MKNEADTYEFTLERVLAAAPELTFDEMLDPRAQLLWWGGDGDIVRATCDLRVGGTATIEWGPSEATLIRTDQVFREIERPHRLVYAETVRQTGFPIYECLLTFTLAPVGEYGHRLVLDVYPINPPDPLMALLEGRKDAVEPLKMETLCGCAEIDGVMQTEIVMVELLTEPHEPETRAQ